MKLGEGRVSGIAIVPAPWFEATSATAEALAATVATSTAFITTRSIRLFEATSTTAFVAATSGLAAVATATEARFATIATATFAVAGWSIEITTRWSRCPVGRSTAAFTIRMIHAYITATEGRTFNAGQHCWS